MKKPELQVTETRYGYSISGLETIYPYVRKKYGKRLKSKRLLKKYAKILIEDAIKSLVKDLRDRQEESNKVSE